MNESLIPVARVGDIEPGGRKRVDVNGERVTLFLLDGEYYAIRDTCPHKNTAPLLRGTLDGIGIKCPNHGFRFDLKTGECNVGAEWNTRIYAVKVIGDDILLAPQGGKESPPGCNTLRGTD